MHFQFTINFKTVNILTIFIQRLSSTSLLPFLVLFVFFCSLFLSFQYKSSRTQMFRVLVSNADFSFYLGTSKSLGKGSHRLELTLIRKSETCGSSRSAACKPSMSLDKNAARKGGSKRFTMWNSPNYTPFFCYLSDSCWEHGWISWLDRFCICTWKWHFLAKMKTKSSYVYLWAGQHEALHHLFQLCKIYLEGA